MIKKLFPILFLTFYISAFAQDDQQKNSSVELPSFVITGKDIISLPKAKKLTSPFVSTVSEEFLKPAFTPDDFEITNVPDPGKKEFNSVDTADYINGSLDAGFGVNLRPFANGNLSKQFNNGIFGIDFSGFNKRAYVDNSDRYLFAGGIRFAFFIGDESPVIPNTQIDVGAKYSFDAYKLYASAKPDERRRLERGHFYFDVKNPANDVFSYDYRLFNTIDRISDESFFENVIGAEGYTQIQIGPVSANAKLKLMNQRLSNDSLDNVNFKLIDIRPYIGLNIWGPVSLQAGFDFFKSDSSSVGNLFGALTIPFGKGVSLYGEYAPQEQALTYYELSKENRFFNTKTLNNIVEHKKNLFDANFKYEYLIYYEVNGGIEYFTSDAYPFWDDENSTGTFHTDYAKIKSGKIFVNFLFHKGPFGRFYADLSYNSLKTDNGNQLPFVPQIAANANYGYDFENGIGFEARLKYYGNSFSDQGNKKKLDPFASLSVKGTYNFSKLLNFYFEANNLTDNKNYIWKGYREDTLDLILGLNYKF